MGDGSASGNGAFESDDLLMARSCRQMRSPHGGESLLGRHARKRRHSSGTPLRTRRPRSSNVNPEPATRSRTVCETRTSPGAASVRLRQRQTQ